MKKTLKWILYVIGGLFVLLIAAALIIPVFFKDDIKAAIEREIAKSVNAEVVFDDVSLSLFSNFPNVTTGVVGLGVLNRAPFEGEVLFAARKFEVEVNLKDILFGDELRVKGISIVDPIVNIHVLKDGRANYDIAIPSEDTVTTETEEAGEFSFGIDHWEVVNADVSYVDESLPYRLVIKGLNHSGSGDFTQDVFDLRTQTKADTVTTAFDGVEYLTNKKVDIDATITISDEFSKYTFKENRVKVNDFAMEFDGFVTMQGDDIGLDLTFKTPENSFKSLLSLVPGIYTEGFEDIKTSGDLAFNGAIKGVYNETSMPGFNVTLNVTDAMFQYPDLPTAISNINIDLLVDNKDGVIENTVVDLKKMHLDFGSNPVDARALISKMYPTHIDASLSARLNLGELTSMFPMEGLEMKGNYSVNLSAKGVYDSLKKTLPSVNATMALANGYVKSADFPIPLERISFSSTVQNKSGKMSETVIDVKDFQMLMDGEQLAADLHLEDLENYKWDLKLNGGIDLEKITKVFPLQGIEMAGKIKANVQTKGTYADLEAGRYDRMPTSGTASAVDFRYAMTDMPEVKLSEARMAFDPRKINLQNVEGTVGRSDFSANGSLSNYLGFVMGNGIIKGQVNLKSNLLDLNEFMTEEETGDVEEETESYGVIPIPKNIDFVFSSTIQKVKLMDYDITKASGDVIVRGGVADLRNLRFNMLGGSFVVNGSYNTKDVNHPKYDLALKIDNVSMKDAANTSSLVRTYAPVAGLVDGKFSTDFKVNGELGQDMMPVLSTVNGEGLIKVAQAALTGSKLISGITAVTKLNDTDNVTMKDVLMSATLKNGKLSVKPFDVKVGSYKTTVAGATSLDGTIDYTLKMDVPAGKLGEEFNSLVSRYTGNKTSSSTIPLTIGLKGSYDDPKASLVSDEQKEQAKEALSTAAKEEGTKAVKEAIKGTEAEKALNKVLGKDSTDSGATTLPVTKEEVKKEVEEKKEEVKQKVEEEAKKKIQNLLKRKDN